VNMHDILLQCMSPVVAQSDVSVRCECFVAIGGEADIARGLWTCRSDANDPSLHLAANFAVTHNAAPW